MTFSDEAWQFRINLNETELQCKADDLVRSFRLDQNFLQNIYSRSC